MNIADDAEMIGKRVLPIKRIEISELNILVVLHQERKLLGVWSLPDHNSILITLRPRSACSCARYLRAAKLALEPVDRIRERLLLLLHRLQLFTDGGILRLH